MLNKPPVLDRLMAGKFKPNLKSPPAINRAADKYKKRPK